MVYCGKINKFLSDGRALYMQDTDSVQYDNRVFRDELALICVVFGVDMWGAKPERIMATFDFLQQLIGNNSTMSKAPYAP
jgi:hypothetical protein